MFHRIQTSKDHASALQCVISYCQATGTGTGPGPGIGDWDLGLGTGMGIGEKVTVKAVILQFV